MICTEEYIKYSPTRRVMADSKRPRPQVLLIIDGFGYSERTEGNAIALAKTPTFDYLYKEYPHTLLDASGISVGLPAGTMGNSEVGHLTIGIGRILYQSYEKINQSIADGSLGKNPVLHETFEFVKSNDSSLHFFGLLSDGGVHSHINHLFELLRLARDNNVDRVYVHAFTDGRDVPPRSSDKYVSQLLEELEKYPGYSLADIVGRYYAMDRDKRWDRTQIAYDMLIQERSQKELTDPVEEIHRRFKQDETDEFLRPILVEKDGIVKDGDAVIFFNFRPDRARQITMAFNYSPNMELKKFNNLKYVTMTQYDDSFDLPVLFPPEKVKDSLAEVYAKHGFRQAHIAETEKYAHVTYFIDGGEEEPFEHEDRILVSSNRTVATYDLAPEMRTMEIVEKAAESIAKKDDGSHYYDLVLLNIAAPDMVGHTGVLEATIRAVEVTDAAVKKLYEASVENGYTLHITADHGNAEQMIKDGKPHTAHTTNPVPYIVTNRSIKLKEGGGLSNVSPTLLDLAGIKKPDEMSDSLVQS